MNNLLNLVAKYSLDIPTKLLDWIPNNKNRNNLYGNPAAINIYWNILREYIANIFN
jgi:hypothetical protein